MTSTKTKTRTTSPKRTTKILTKTGTCPRKKTKKKTTKTRKKSSAGRPLARHPAVYASPSKTKLRFSVRLLKHENHCVHFAGGAGPAFRGCTYRAGRSTCTGSPLATSRANRSAPAGRERHQG